MTRIKDISNELTEATVAIPQSGKVKNIISKQSGTIHLQEEDYSQMENIQDT